LRLRVEQCDGVQRWQFQPLANALNIQLDLLDSTAQRIRLQFELGNTPRQLQWRDGVATLEGKVLPGQTVMASQREAIGELQFLPATPYQSGKYPVTQGQDVLKKIILDGNFQ